MFILDPLHDYAIVHALPDVMQRIAATHPDQPLPDWVPRDGKGVIALTDKMASEGMPADGGTAMRGGKGDRTAVTTLLVGRVIWVGPGKHREGMFIPPTIVPGQLVLFMPRTVSYEFSLHGRNIKIVPYHEMVSTVREVSRDSFEWQVFTELVKRAASELERAEPEAANDAQQSAAEAV